MHSLWQTGQGQEFQPNPMCKMRIQGQEQKMKKLYQCGCCRRFSESKKKAKDCAKECFVKKFFDDPAVRLGFEELPQDPPHIRPWEGNIKPKGKWIILEMFGWATNKKGFVEWFCKKRE